MFEPLVFKHEYLFTEFKLLEIIFLAKIDFVCMMTKELQKKSFSIGPRLLKIQLESTDYCLNLLIVKPVFKVCKDDHEF
jgi:hypothetical protein